MNDYVAPKDKRKAFNCPHCNSYAHQIWHDSVSGRNEDSVRVNFYYVKLTKCVKCSNKSIWVCYLKEGKFTENKEFVLIHPNISNFEFPNNDLPDEIKNDFNEARDICNRSPRGAAALLRLCIENICGHLKIPGKDLNNKIKKLVEDNFPEEIQKAFDIVRVVGNESVHPGQMDLKDDVETASNLFSLVNFIAETLISKPNKIKEIYDKIIPENKKKGIKDRDKKNATSK